MSFESRLKEARLRSGLKQKNVADMLGISQQSYAQYERGVRRPKRETLAKISEVLDVGYTYAHNGEPYFYCFVDTIPAPEYAENEEFNKRQYEDAMCCVTDNKIVIPVREATVESIKEREQEDRELAFLNKMDAFREKLNDKGQDKALEQVELLTKIPEYRKDEDSDKNADNSDK